MSRRNAEQLTLESLLQKLLEISFFDHVVRLPAVLLPLRRCIG